MGPGPGTSLAACARIAPQLELIGDPIVTRNAPGVLRLAHAVEIRAVLGSRRLVPRRGRVHILGACVLASRQLGAGTLRGKLVLPGKLRW